MLLPLTTQAGAPPTNLNTQLAAMQAQINALTKRLEQLEQMIPSRLPPSKVTTNVQPELTSYQKLGMLRVNWKRLQLNLSQAQLQQLLGKPHSTLTLSQQTLWYYRYPGIGSGSVMLNSRGKVSGWQAPPFHSW